jgi:hypothetical protein
MLAIGPETQRRYHVGIASVLRRCAIGTVEYPMKGERMIRGRCMCGQVRYNATGGMRWAMLCHCEDCQRAAGADYVSWFGIANEDLTWEGERAFHGSSPAVRRSFCPTCGTPMSYETAKLADETHLYAPSLDDRSFYRPSRHIYWGEHAPWLAEAWGLPKHVKGTESEIVP